MKNIFAQFTLFELAKGFALIMYQFKQKTRFDDINILGDKVA